MKRLLFLVVVMLVVAACAQEGGKTGEYVAKIDGTVITKDAAQKEMNTLPPMAKQFFQGPEGNTRFVDELVKKEMLYLEAKKRGLDKDEEYQRKLEEFRKFSLINRLLEKEMEAAAKVSDEEMKAYYDQHKDDFTDKTQVRIAQIVVKNEDDAKRVYERLDKGEDFAKVASEMSIDKASARSGGDLGSFKRGEMGPQLEATAFRLKKGEVSRNPVPGKDGLHILKLLDAKGTVVEFDKVKGVLAQRLTSEKQRETFDKFLDNLKKGYKVEVNKEVVAKLSASPQEPASPGAEQKGPADKAEKTEKKEKEK
jgi:peptidyl-prolyl cis-trans isomerase C